MGYSFLLREDLLLRRSLKVTDDDGCLKLIQHHRCAEGSDVGFALEF